MWKMPTLMTEENGLRTYASEQLKDRHGKLIWMTLCEEWVPGEDGEEGRWEAFYRMGK
jgi:hypothetical protein